MTARNDFWNTGLATMALLEWLDGPARLSTSFAALPEVRAALDQVFPATRREQASNLSSTSAKPPASAWFPEELQRDSEAIRSH